MEGKVSTVDTLKYVDLSRVSECWFENMLKTVNISCGMEQFR